MGQAQLAVVGKNIDGHYPVAIAEYLMFLQQLLFAMCHVRQVGFQIGELRILLAEAVPPRRQPTGDFHDLRYTGFDQLVQAMVNQMMPLQ